MSKILAIVSLAGVILTVGCTSQTNNDITVEEPTVVEETVTIEVDPEYSQFSNEFYSIDYPSKLDSIERGYKYMSFDNDNEETEMGVRIREGEVSLYLDQEPVRKVEFNENEFNLYISETGYCDGPGCGAPYIAYSLHDGERTFIIEFFNQTEETDMSRQVLKSFSLL